MTKFGLILFCALSIFIMPNCGTKHCTDDNNTYNYLDESDIKKIPYQGNPTQNFIGHKGHELELISQNEHKGFKYTNRDGDPDCPYHYYNEYRERVLEIKSDFLFANSIFWLVQYQKGIKWGESNYYNISLSLNGDIILSSKLYDNTPFKDSVYVNGKWLKAFYIQKDNNSFKWTPNFGITMFVLNDEEFTIIP
jgi:hypothetical protein